MASEIRLLITTGDPDGVGYEVTNKALHAIGPKSGVQFIFYRSPASLRPPLTKKFKHKLVTSAAEAARQPFDARTLIEIRSEKAPALWVEEAAKLCLNKIFQGMVTAPLSKTSITAAGMHDVGHTEILARVTGQRDLFMGFLGRKFNVVLATGHRPLREALEQMNLDTLARAVKAAKELREILPAARRQRPLALVGVNPHAGEGGLLGSEESLFLAWIKSSRLSGDLHGPLVPDGAFLEKNWPLYSAYICPYHDQGLIPFKMVHGFESGVHLTLGLPFVRTSVDHGTAKELFGKNKAQSGSMKDALLTAIRLIQKRVR